MSYHPEHNNKKQRAQKRGEKEKTNERIYKNSPQDLALASNRAPNKIRSTRLLQIHYQYKLSINTT